MKLYILIKRFSTVAAISFLASAPSVLAQVPGAEKGAAGMNAVMIKFFGSNTNFISKADVRVLDKDNHETTSMVMGFEMLAGKMRVEVNMAEVKSRDMSPEMAASMKQIGMDRMVTVLLPEKKSVLSIYPGLKSYAETPMPKEEAEAAEAGYKIAKTRLGKETIDGHPCEKNDVTLTDSKGQKQQAVLWNATDLQNFPIQMQIPADDVTLVMKFKDVKLGRPELSDFEAPAGMTKYDDISTLMSDAVTKRVSGGASK